MIKHLIWCFFFFSSRRRHTRWTGDWSSDVCSSDLVSAIMQIPIGARIIMIADTLDAMTTDRPYRQALPLERVRSEERRVGKEWRSRWSACHCKEKKVSAMIYENKVLA